MGTPTKAIKAHVCSETNPADLPRKIKMTPASLTTTLPRNASVAFQ